MLKLLLLIREVFAFYLRDSAYFLMLYLDQESQAIIDWLSALDFFKIQIDTLSRRQEGTGEWLFETPQFQAWLSGEEKTLWCSGQLIYFYFHLKASLY
jgi:hypothetical protein